MALSRCHNLYYYSSAVRTNLSSQMCPHKSVLTNLSSKCDIFLAARPQFDSDHGVDFYAHTCCQSTTFGPLFALYCPLFFTILFFNNVAFRPRRVVSAAVFALYVATALRQINR